MDTLSQNCHSTGTQWGTRPKLFPVNLFLYCASTLLPVIYVLHLTIMFPYHASMVYFLSHSVLFSSSFHFDFGKSFCQHCAPALCI